MSLILNRSVFTVKRAVFFNPLIESFVTKFLDIPKSNWYQQLRSGVHFDEKKLQQIIIYKFNAILPNHGIIYYDKAIQSLIAPFDKCIPDFLLWDNDYSKWYVIEVELKDHSIGHIRKQLTTFYNGDYKDVDGISSYVKDKYPALDISRFKALISSPPKLMLISDEIRQEWIDEFEPLGYRFCTLQVYTDERDNLLYRIAGDFPQEYQTFSLCTLNKKIQSLDFINPSFFALYGFTDKQIIKVYYKGIPEDWSYRINENGSVSLIYLGDFIPIPELSNNWKLIANTKGQLHIIK